MSSDPQNEVRVAPEEHHPREETVISLPGVPIESVPEKDELNFWGPDVHYVGSAITAEEEQPHQYVVPTIPICIIVLLVFTTMAQNFSSSIVTLFMQNTLHYGPVEISKYYVYLGFVGWSEPGIGFLADVFSVFGERRRPLILFSSCVNIAIYLLYFFKPSVTEAWGTFVGVAVVAQVFLMCIYIPINGLLVEVGRQDGETQKESTARIASIMSKAMVWRSVGTLASSIIQTYVLVYASTRMTLGITSGFFFMIIPLVLLCPRSLFLRRRDLPNIFRRVYGAGKDIQRTFNIHDLRSDGFCFIFVLGFVFIYTMMPDSSNVYYNFLYMYPYQPWFFSFMSCCGSLGSVCGAYIFSWWMDRRSRREMEGGKKTSTFFLFFIGSCAWALGYATNIMLCTGFIEYSLHIPPEYFIPIDNFFMQLFVRFAFMPTIAVAAEHAPKTFEATAFEVFAVASLGGGTVSGIITLLLVENFHMSWGHYEKLWILILISICCKLAMIPLAWLLPERRVPGVDSSLESATLPSVEDEDLYFAERHPSHGEAHEPKE